MAEHSVLNLFNKMIRQEIDVSKYTISKATTSLQGSVFNSPLDLADSVKGTTSTISAPASGYFGDFDVIDQGGSYLITIQSGAYNGVSWNTKEFVIEKGGQTGVNSEVIYTETRYFYIYIDTSQGVLALQEYGSSEEADMAHFVLMMIIIPPNSNGISYTYNSDEAYAKFIYGYQANFLYYFLMYSGSAAEVMTELPAAKIVGNLTIEGTTTITNDSESVLLTPDGMYIYDVANVTSLGLT
ncbi:MAG: hypothetical protein WC942_12445, partial [Clostridia bacterium]